MPYKPNTCDMWHFETWPTLECHTNQTHMTRWEIDSSVRRSPGHYRFGLSALGIVFWVKVRLTVLDDVGDGLLEFVRHVADDCEDDQSREHAGEAVDQRHDDGISAKTMLFNDATSHYIFCNGKIMGLNRDENGLTKKIRKIMFIKFREPLMWWCPYPEKLNSGK